MTNRIRLCILDMCENKSSKVPNGIRTWPRRISASPTSHHKGDRAVGGERAIEMLTRKTKEVSYPLSSRGNCDQCEDQSKDILNLIHKEDLSDI